MASKLWLHFNTNLNVQFNFKGSVNETGKAVIVVLQFPLILWYRFSAGKNRE